MERTAVRSTDIAIIGYEKNTQTLEVAFKTGRVYHYSDVPGAVYEEFLKAPSYGNYFKDNIRDRFQSKKIK